MWIDVSPYLLWIVRGAWVLGGLSLIFGIFTAAGPGHSIGLYQWLMARINWRVEPVDRGREIRTTRVLGILLILLSLALLGTLATRGI